MLSPFDLKRIQGLPDTFILCGSKTKQAEQLCSALPVPFTTLIINGVNGFFRDHRYRSILCNSDAGRVDRDGVFVCGNLSVHGENKARRREWERHQQVVVERKRRRDSRMERLVYGNNKGKREAFASEAERLGIHLKVTGVRKRRELSYTVGVNSVTDARVHRLSRFILPRGWTYVLVERENKRNALDDAKWVSPSGEIYRSANKAKSVVENC